MFDCLDGIEVDACDAHGVDLAKAGGLAALAGGVVEPGFAGNGQVELRCQFRGHDRVAAGAGVDDEAERTFAVDGDHDVGLAVGHLHSNGVDLVRKDEARRSGLCGWIGPGTVTTMQMPPASPGSSSPLLADQRMAYPCPNSTLNGGTKIQSNVWPRAVIGSLRTGPAVGRPGSTMNRYADNRSFARQDQPGAGDRSAAGGRVSCAGDGLSDAGNA